MEKKVMKKMLGKRQNLNAILRKKNYRGEEFSFDINQEKQKTEDRRKFKRFTKVEFCRLYLFKVDGKENNVLKRVGLNVFLFSLSFSIRLKTSRVAGFPMFYFSFRMSSCSGKYRCIMFKCCRKMFSCVEESRSLVEVLIRLEVWEVH
jgi:hypothetical protein